MNYRLQKDGCKVIADILSGSGEKLNGIYVTYGGSELKTAPEVDWQFFDYLAMTKGCGYARIPVRSCQSMQDGALLFTGLLATSDLVGAKPTKKTKLTTATLAVLNSDSTKDRFVYTSLLASQAPLISGTHVIIDLYMKIGG